MSNCRGNPDKGMSASPAEPELHLKGSADFINIVSHTPHTALIKQHNRTIQQYYWKMFRFYHS